jgi:hypothetical protein
MSEEERNFKQFNRRLQTSIEIEPHLYAPLLDMEMLTRIIEIRETVMETARKAGGVSIQEVDGRQLEITPMPNPDDIPMWLVHDVTKSRWAIKCGVLPRDEMLWELIDFLSEPATKN